MGLQLQGVSSLGALALHGLGMRLQLQGVSSLGALALHVQGMPQGHCIASMAHLGALALHRQQLWELWHCSGASSLCAHQTLGAVALQRQQLVGTSSCL